jgi:hypothetical protein
LNGVEAEAVEEINGRTDQQVLGLALLPRTSLLLDICRKYTIVGQGRQMEASKPLNIWSVVSPRALLAILLFFVLDPTLKRAVIHLVERSINSDRREERLTDPSR